MLRLITFGLFLSSQCAYARTVLSFPGDEGLLRDATDEYRKKHQGALPRNWDDIAPHVAESKFREIKSRYEFVTRSLELRGEESGQVLFLGTGAVVERGKSGRGRYVVCHREGRIFYKWLKETDVQTLLATGSLEVESSLVIKEREERKFKRILSVGGLAIIALVLGILAVKKSRRAKAP